MGKRVPTFIEIRDQLADWARADGQFTWYDGRKDRIPERSIVYMIEMGDSAEGKQFVESTLREGPKCGMTGGVFAWYAQASTYAKNKLFN